MRTNDANTDIRDRVRKLGLFLWQFAKECNVNASTMTVWLREELPKDDQRRVIMERVLKELERTVE